MKYRLQHAFDAQNAGNYISELLDFKFFWGSMPPDPPSLKGPYGPFSITAVCSTSNSRLSPKLLKPLNPWTLNSYRAAVPEAFQSLYMIGQISDQSEAGLFSS